MAKDEPVPVDEDSGATIRTWHIIVAVALVGALVVAAVALSSRQDSYVYNGFTFTEARCPTGDDGCWSTDVVLNIGVRPILFYNGPRQVEDVIVEPPAVERVLSMVPRPNSTGSVIIAFDEGVPGEVGIAAANIARITGEKVYRIPTTGAVYGQQVTCADSHENRTVIYLAQTDVEGVRLLDSGCVVLGAPDTEGLLEVSDAFSYHLLRIMR